MSFPLPLPQHLNYILMVFVLERLSRGRAGNLQRCSAGEQEGLMKERMDSGTMVFICPRITPRGAGDYMLQSTNTATPARPHALSGRNRIKRPDPHAGYCFSPYCCCCCLPVFHGGLLITVSFNTGQSSQFLAHACECESYSIHGKGVIA